MSRRRFEQARAREDAEWMAAQDAREARIREGAEVGLQISRSRADEELKSGLMAAKSGMENALMLARALRASRQRARHVTTQTPGGEQ